jgi:hypothetical protein
MLATVGPMDAADLHLRHDLGVRPGESDPAGMLCRVLLLLMLLAAIVPMAALAWWLA